MPRGINNRLIRSRAGPRVDPDLRRKRRRCLVTGPAGLGAAGNMKMQERRGGAQRAIGDFLMHFGRVVITFDEVTGEITGGDIGWKS